jgi:CheY-like chemotaxis protein
MVDSIESKKQRILIVDDEAPMRELLLESLSPEGYDLVAATDGRDALNQVLRQAPDLILMDVRMPKLDGVTLCKALRIEKETQTIPIIVLTALASRDRLEECMAAGADDFISKPFDVVELRIRVRAMLKLKHVNDEVDRLQKYILTLRELRGESPETPTA